MLAVIGDNERDQLTALLEKLLDRPDKQSSRRARSNVEIAERTECVASGWLWLPRRELSFSSARLLLRGGHVGRLWFVFPMNANRIGM
jgi:hypothetical protein